MLGRDRRIKTWTEKVSEGTRKSLKKGNPVMDINPTL
jgi:hypothetical protein